jgi:hypothetical protein
LRMSSASAAIPENEKPPGIVSRYPSFCFTSFLTRDEQAVCSSPRVLGHDTDPD